MTEIVTVNSQAYDTYATVVEADLYQQANFLAVVWPTLTDDQKGQLLVTGTRLLDRQCWLGEKTVESQPLQWPRTDTGIDGVEDDTVPEDIVNGSIELAQALAEGSDAATSQVPGAQKIQTLKAGSVSLTYFRGAEGVTAVFSRFPLPVQELVRQYLCSSQRISGLIVTGTDGTSVTDDDLGFNRGI